MANKSPLEMKPIEIKNNFFPDPPPTPTPINLDVASLFAMVTNILSPATNVVDNIFQVYVYVTTLHKLFIIIIVIL